MTIGGWHRDRSPSIQYDAVSHLLARVGLLALDAGMEGEAESIFRYVRKVLAEPAVLDVSRAIVMLQRGEALRAVSVLRESVLSEDPTHGPANAALGFALQSAGLPGGRECFERVLAASIDPEARAVALEGLEGGCE